jgi:hypothetical protein
LDASHYRGNIHHDKGKILNGLVLGWQRNLSGTEAAGQKSPTPTIAGERGSTGIDGLSCVHGLSVMEILHLGNFL